MTKIHCLLLVITVAATGLYSYAQPLVHKEPHHPPVFKNRKVRVLDVQAWPSDTTLFHTHIRDIAYITLQGTDVWLQERGSAPRTVTLPTGWVGSNITHSGQPFTHRFANAGERSFRLIAIELLREHPGRTFQKAGERVHENERFSIQKIGAGTYHLDHPCIIITVRTADDIQILKEIRYVRRTRKGLLVDKMDSEVITYLVQWK